jgi:hypothetical protein
MKNFLDICIGILLCVAIYIAAPVWWNYKLLYFKRKIWIAFGFCPRCNCRVNFDRTGRALCPSCGRPC